MTHPITPVPLLDPRRQNFPLRTELTAAFHEVLDSGQFILGQAVEVFEQEIADLVGSKHAVGVTSGSDALILALMALGVGEGDEVLCPTFTFFATAGAISRVGATPVWVDSCPVCFNIDVSMAAKKMTSRTRAIIPVHLFGQTAEMDQCNAFAKEHGLFVIEDAAQSIGAKYDGKSAGSMSDFGTYSFFPSKNLGGFGDGGMIVTNDDELAEKARVLRGHGAKPKYHHLLVGGNFRLDPLQAALLSVKLAHLKSYAEGRAANAQFYIDKLSHVPGIRQADPALCCGGEVIEPISNDAEPELILPVAGPGREHVWNQFTIRARGVAKNGASTRDALLEFLRERQIGCEIYYPKTMDQQPCFADVASDPATLGNAHVLANEVLSIPIFPELSEDERSIVADAISSFVNAWHR